MKAFVHCLLAAAVAVVALLPLAAAPDAPRVILISIDGLMPSSYTARARAERRPCAPWRATASGPTAWSACCRR